MTDEPSFEVPARPERRFPASGGVEYDGEVVFSLAPGEDRSTEVLDAVLADILDDDRYVRGDFFDLPAPVYLVRDETVGTSFRVVVRGGTVRLHVLPHTDPSALAALYDALEAATDVDWSVECRADPAIEE
jgi:hypothetical protein